MEESLQELRRSHCLPQFGALCGAGQRGGPRASGGHAPQDPRALLPQIKNAGAVFLGAWAPEPLGDYLAGPDHVLPTSGTARFFSPLSVDSFLKTMSVLEFDRASLEPIHDEVIAFAEAEHLTAHANSIRVRFEE